MLFLVLWLLQMDALPCYQLAGTTWLSAAINLRQVKDNSVTEPSLVLSAHATLLERHFGSELFFTLQLTCPFNSHIICKHDFRNREVKAELEGCFRSFHLHIFQSPAQPQPRDSSRLSRAKSKCVCAWRKIAT